MAKNDLVKEIKVYTRQCHDCGKELITIDAMSA